MLLGVGWSTTKSNGWQNWKRKETHITQWGRGRQSVRLEYLLRNLQESNSKYNLASRLIPGTHDVI